MGLQLNDRALSNRHRRKYSPRAALKAPVAYALLQWARLEADASSALLDPFCGSGTILIEAGQLWPQLELCGCDIDERAVNGARVNAAAAGLGDRLQLLRADARRLDEVYTAGSFRTIVTNPPYGVRFGKHLNFSRFYQRLLHQCWTVLAAGGIMVVVVWKRLGSTFEHPVVWQTWSRASNSFECPASSKIARGTPVRVQLLR